MVKERKKGSTTSKSRAELISQGKSKLWEALIQSIWDVAFCMIVWYFYFGPRGYDMREFSFVAGSYVAVIRPSRGWKEFKTHLSKWGAAALAVADQYNSVYVDEEDRERKDE